MFVNDIFEKGPRRSQSGAGPKQSETEFGYRKLDPLIHKARQKYPLASNDTEALALFIADKEEADVKDLEGKVGSVNKNAQTLIQRQQQVLQKQNKELDAIEQELNATQDENMRQEKDIEQLVKGVNDANARYAAQEERFRDLTARVAAQKLTQTDVDAANIAKELERSDDARAKSFGAPQIVRNDVNEGDREWDEGNTEPPNNFAVYINGKKWKVFKGHGHFAGDFREIQQHRKLQNWAQAKSASTGKEWKVYVTGEPTTESINEAPYGFGQDWDPVASRVGSDPSDVLPDVPEDFNPTIAWRKIMLLKNELGRMAGLKYDERAKIVAEIRKLENQLSLYKAHIQSQPGYGRHEPSESDEGAPYIKYTQETYGRGQPFAKTLKGAISGAKRDIMTQKVTDYIIVTDNKHKVVYVWSQYPNDDLPRRGDTFQPERLRNRWESAEPKSVNAVVEATESDIEKHIMEMRHAGYDISEGYGSYYCSTKKKMVQRKGPKQSRSSK